MELALVSACVCSFFPYCLVVFLLLYFPYSAVRCYAAVALPCQFLSSCMILLWMK